MRQQHSNISIGNGRHTVSRLHTQCCCSVTTLAACSIFSTFAEGDVNPSTGTNSARGSSMLERSDGMEVAAFSDGRSLFAMVSAAIRERIRGSSATMYGVSWYGGSGMLLPFWTCEPPRGMELL